jgi:hypothetical protein
MYSARVTVTTSADGAAIVRPALRDAPPAVAVIIAVVDVVTDDVDTMKYAVVEP